MSTIKLFSNAKSGFNRDIVECKALMKRMFFFLFMPDLIETLWNVKSFVFLKIFRKLLDLIETLWNVKKSLAV